MVLRNQSAAVGDAVSSAKDIPQEISFYSIVATRINYLQLQPVIARSNDVSEAFNSYVIRQQIGVTRFRLDQCGYQVVELRVQSFKSRHSKFSPVLDSI